MRPLLDRHGIEVIAVSKDTPAQVRAHRSRDELSLTLLSDPELELITAFGLRHVGALEFRTFLIGGIRFPLGYPVGFRTMAIPTTLILDEAHVVQWIDQAEDYRVRGDEARTREALTATFGEPS